MTDTPAVWIVRHSESTFHVEHRWAGWLDPELTQQGRNDAVRAADYWRHHTPHRVASSDLRRASHGAQLIADALGVEAGPILPGLRERNAGTWQGQLLSDIADDPAYQAWCRDQTQTPPGGEPHPEFLSRLRDSLSFLLADNQRTVAVTHDGVVTAVCALLHVERPERVRPLVDAVHVTISPSGHLVGHFVSAPYEAL